MEKEDLSIAKFYDLEKEYDLFSLRFCGINYWQLIRFYVYTDVRLSAFTISSAKVKRKFGQEIFGALFQATRMLFRWKKLLPTDVVQIRPLVQTVTNGESNDRQYDYFSLDKDIRVTDIYALGAYNAVQDKTVVTMAGAEAKIVLWKIKRKLFGTKDIDDRQKNVLQNFLSGLKEIYGTAPSLEQVIGYIQYTVACYIHYRKSFLKLFKKISPSVVMVYQNYDDHMFPAVAAAKELGIPSIELQHGEIVDHVAYWYEDVSDNGKMLPDYLFSYGQWWIDNSKLPECMKAIPVGNPYLENQVNKYPKNIDRKVITFFSNYISGCDMVSLIESCYEEILSLGYRIVFKLHPREVTNWKNDYPFLVDHPEIQVVESGSIYKLLSESSVIMGLRSTVFYEALIYEHVTIALNPKGEMRYLLNNGLAHAVEGKEDLLKLLEKENDSKCEKGSMPDFWHPDSARNIAEFIKSLIHR